MGADEDKAEFELLKKHLKSIVVMSKKVLTPGGLLYEYREQIGKPINFRKFGAWSMDSLLQKMPDTFARVEVRGNCGQLLSTVQLKDLSNVGHIHDMVVNQRCNKVGGVVKTKYNTLDPHRLASGPAQGSLHKPDDHSPNRYRSRRPRSQSPLPRRRSFSPERRRHQRSSRSPSRDRARRMRRRSSSRRRSRSRRRSSNRRHRRASTPSSSSSHSSHSSTTASEELRKTSTSKKEVEPVVRDSPSKELWVATETKGVSPVRKCNDSPLKKPSPDMSFQTLFDTIANLSRVMNMDKLPPDVKEKEPTAVLNPEGPIAIPDRSLKRPMETTPTGANTPAVTVAAETAQPPKKRCYEQDLRVQNYGFTSVEEMVSAMPGQFNVHGTNSHLSVSCPGRPTNSGLQPAAPPQDPRRQPPVESNSRIADIDEKVQTMMTRLLPVAAPDALKDIETITIDEVADQHEHCIPAGYALDPMPNKFTQSQPNLSVVVCEVYSPSRFYIRYLKFQPKIETLMEELRISYSSGNINAYRLARLEEGLYVATQYLDKWHRGCISKVLSSTTAMVSYVDFGTDEEKDISQLYYLMNTPPLKVHMMAAAAELSNVTPVGTDNWTAMAKVRFSELVGSKSLVAKFRSGGTIGNQVLKLSLSQVDMVSQRVVLDVAENLVVEGHASYIEPTTSTRVELVSPAPQTLSAGRSTTNFQQPSNVHGCFANVDLTPAQHAAAYTSEVETVCCILQDMNRKLSTKYGERVVMHALEKVRLKPFADTDANSLIQMSNILCGNVFPTMLPHPAVHNLMAPNNCIPTASRITPQGIRQDQNPTVMDLVKAERGGRQ